MAFSNWEFYYTGFFAHFTHVLTSTTSLAPLVGGASLQMGGEGSFPIEAGKMEGILGVPDNAETPLGPIEFLRGSLRTLVRVHESFGTGRQQVGMLCQWEADSGTVVNTYACYVLLLDGPQNLSAWERIILGCVQADNPLSNQTFPILDELTILAEAPVSRSPASVTALELTWYTNRVDYMNNQRLIGKIGTATDYSDLTTVVSWSTTDYPGPSQAGGTTGLQSYSGLLVRYDAVPDVIDHTITVLFDQTQLDEITTTPVPGMLRARQRARRTRRKDARHMPLHTVELDARI